MSGKFWFMKSLITTLYVSGFLWAAAQASTITVVPVVEPLSLHGSDGDETIVASCEALRACVMSRPMALSGAFPEALVDAIRSPHLIPSNDLTFKVQEANLQVLSNIGISRKMTAAQSLTVRLNIARLVIPAEVDLTSRQILKLTIVALRETFEEYQHPQTPPLSVALVLEGADEGKASLRDLAVKFMIGEPRGIIDHVF